MVGLFYCQNFLNYRYQKEVINEDLQVMMATFGKTVLKLRFLILNLIIKNIKPQKASKILDK